VLVFSLLTSMPGDPLDRMLEDNPDFTYEDYMRLRSIYGLDDPVYIRYFKWAGQVLQGNLGYSRQYKIPVQNLVLPRLNNTLILSIMALVFALVVALALGIISAVKQYSFIDYASMAIAFSRFFAGAVIVETVFSYPGMGKLLYDSVMGNDFVVSMAILMLLAFMVLWGNLIADILYGWVDPRIRYD